MSVWKPNLRQEDFLALPDSIFEALYGGAAGGGKSEVLMNLPIVRKFIDYPNFRGLIMRRTFPELEKSLISRSHNYFPSTQGKFNSTARRWKWPSGAVIDFGYAEYESDIRKYDTAEYHYIALDELTSFTEFQYRYITSRCRTSDPKLPAIIRAGSNPGNVGHGWVRSRFVEPARDGYKIIVDLVTNQKRIFIPAKLFDNPHISVTDPNYADRLKILPVAEMKAKLEGDWWTYEGQVFEDFRAQKFHDEPDNALHVVDDFAIPNWWPVVCAGDWGFSAMTWFGWAAISPDSRMYLFREYTAKRQLISTWATEVGAICDQYKDRLVENIGLDPSAWQQRGALKTIVEQFEESSGYVTQRADNDRIGGKNLLQEYIRWKAKPSRKIPFNNFDQDLADRIFRLYGDEKYKEYISMYMDEKPELNLPKLQIFKSCPKVVEAIQLCTYDPDKKEDVAEFSGDDPYDGLRYLVKLTDKWINSKNKESEKLDKLGKIYADLQRTGDQTSFYMRMKKVDSDLKQDIDPGFYGVSRRRPNMTRISRS